MSSETLWRCPDSGALVPITNRPGLPADIPGHGCSSRACEYAGCRLERPAVEMVQFSTGSWFCPDHALFLAGQRVRAYHKEVENFKKQLLQTTLEAHHGNRTYAARALGLPRTYLLRLMRDLEVRVPRG